MAEPTRPSASRHVWSWPWSGPRCCATARTRTRPRRCTWSRAPIRSQRAARVGRDAHPGQAAELQQPARRGRGRRAGARPPGRGHRHRQARQPLRRGGGGGPGQRLGGCAVGRPGECLRRRGGRQGRRRPGARGAARVALPGGGRCLCVRFRRPGHPGAPRPTSGCWRTRASWACPRPSVELRSAGGAVLATDADVSIDLPADLDQRRQPGRRPRPR